MTNSNKIFYTKKRILKFPNSTGLVSDEDIMSLFMGFVRLIKTNTEMQVEQKYLNKIKSLEYQLKTYTHRD